MLDPGTATRRRQSLRAGLFHRLQLLALVAEDLESERGRTIDEKVRSLQISMKPAVDVEIAESFERLLESSSYDHFVEPIGVGVA